MNKKFISRFISFMLVFTVLCCGSVSASAYDSIYTIKASDWTVPEDSGVLSFNYRGDVVGSSNDAYYCSVSPDDLTIIEDVHININASDFRFKQFYIFTNNVYVYIVNFNDTYIDLFLDDSGHLYFLCEPQAANTKDKYYIDFYRMSYPFDKIVKTSTKSIGWTDDCDYQCNTYFQFYTAGLLAPEYSTVDVYEYVNGFVHLRSDVIVYEADDPIVDTFEYTCNIEKSLNVYSGHTMFLLGGEDINRFKYGTYAFSFDDVGCNTYAETFFAYVDYTLILTPVSASGSSDFIETTTLLNETLIGDGFSTTTVPEDFFIFNDYIVYWQNNYLCEDSSDTYAVVLYWYFASDTLCAFMPGTIDIIEYESYESDMEHNEVMGAIDEAAASISGSINDAASDLGQEIAQSATDIQSSINQSTTKIITSVDNVSDSIDNASSAITDKLSDVQEEVVDELQNVAGSVDDASNKLSDKLGEVKDGITNKLTEIKDNLLDGIKSFFIPSDDVMEEIDDKWDELLKTRFGALYEVSDIISDFASEMSWDYVSNAGVKNTITMPSVTVRLVDTDFTFGGYEVKVVPDGFDVLTAALKGISLLFALYCL